MSSLHLIEAAVASLAAVVVIAMLARLRRARRLARDRRLLGECWAVYQAARQIHDEASAAFLAMLEVARERRRQDSGRR